MDSVEVARISDLTKEFTLNDSDEDVQVFTMKIGNDPDKSHLTASFPVTKYPFINESEGDFTQHLIDDFRSEQKELDDSSVSHLDFNQHFEIKYRSNELMVFLYTRSISFGNNYEDTSHASLFDLKNERKLFPSDLFESDEAFTSFAEEVRLKAEKAVRERFNERGAFANQEERDVVWKEILPLIEKGTKPSNENYDGLYLNAAKQWYVNFDKYQIANGSMGSFVIELPQELMRKYISKALVRMLLETHEEEAAIVDDEVEIIPQSAEPVIKEIDPEAPCVALTFDDGPSVYTPKLLDILKEENVKATFFVLGKSAAVQKKTMKRMAEEGHNIGNHSYDHKNFAKISEEEAHRQITLTDQIVQDITSARPTYFRFPYGAFTKTS
ncbi:polysaccharide deacetylase family protein [Porphyromonas macacae]|uniref:polysaccharide deacetylase family protein n=1 Tax=Porphyromonas macacae TaxID=28115 RepID=UPI00192E6BE0|nr:polysaccharide deacetylase family protein [Porphyromonas macacae]